MTLGKISRLQSNPFLPSRSLLFFSLLFFSVLPLFLFFSPLASYGFLIFISSVRRRTRQSLVASKRVSFGGYDIRVFENDGILKSLLLPAEKSVENVPPVAASQAREPLSFVTEKRGVILIGFKITVSHFMCIVTGAESRRHCQRARLCVKRRFQRRHERV